MASLFYQFMFDPVLADSGLKLGLSTVSARGSSTARTFQMAEEPCCERKCLISSKILEKTFVL